MIKYPEQKVKHLRPSLWCFILKTVHTDKNAGIRKGYAMPVIVKGHLLDRHRPTVCVPVTKNTEEEILKEIRHLCRQDVEMIEWRADFYEDLLDEEKLKQILEKIGRIVEDHILLVTIRTKAQGGEIALDETEYARLLLTIAITHKADILDVELLSLKDPARSIARLHEHGTVILASHHDFDKTPEKAVMLSVLEHMKEADADLVKLAVMPKSMEDVLLLLEATLQFHRQDPHVPLITISMGSLGLLSRLTGQIFGSCITFASMGQASAPGQIDAKELAEALDFIDKYYR